MRADNYLYTRAIPMLASLPQNDSSHHRVFALDALRGLAVILMMEQHLGVWLWNGRVKSHTLPILVAFNSLGGAAAPLFVTLAGVGCALLFASRPHVNNLLIRRGLVMFGFAVLLNLLTPNWFSLGSWYVLHMMAFAMVTAPLWCRLSNRTILASMVGILGATMWIQTWLNTPFQQSNVRMSSLSMPGGPLRLALAEGHFPIFPWLSMFLLGVVVGRWIKEKAIRKIMLLALATGSLTTLLVVVAMFVKHVPALAIFKSMPWKRLILWNLSFYPAHLIVFLLLQTVVLILVAGTLKLNERWPFTENNFLVCLGRISLTLLMVHVVVFRELTRPIGLWQDLDAWVTLLIIGIWILCCVWIARVWQKYYYRYGAEWLLRKIAG